MRSGGAGLLLAVALVSCDVAPTAPLLAPELRPELHIYLWGDATDGGLIGVAAQPLDLDYRLPVGTVIPIDIITSAGDSEVVRIGFGYCHDRRKWIYECQRLTVTMRDGRDPREAEAIVRSLGGRWIGNDVPGRDFYYTLGSLDRTLLAVRQYSGVRSANLHYATTEPASFEILGQYYIGALKFTHGGPRPRNGIVTARPGETVRARYSQPDGSERIWDYTLPQAP
ncbi:MAG: hypothetical protein WD771_05500 [Gemmatimonadaceae bacterium]